MKDKGYIEVTGKGMLGTEDVLHGPRFESKGLLWVLGLRCGCTICGGGNTWGMEGGG